MRPALSGLSECLQDCRGVLIDSNILLDVATNDPKWSDWSGSALAECTERATLILNPIIYAEVSIGCSTIEALNAALPSNLYQRESLPWEAGFWRVSLFWPISDGAARATRHCRTSTSAPRRH